MDPMGYRFRYQICQPGAANYAPQTAQPKKPPGQGPFWVHPLPVAPAALRLAANPIFLETKGRENQENNM
jgi:hypothetical protein